MHEPLAARIRFLTASEGGRLTPVMSGVRPAMKIGDTFTSCIIRATTADEVFEPGRDYDVSLELLFFEEYGHSLDMSASISLFEGERLVATGRFAEG
jgi:translation elongation factor EF-Tu-like GTPase